MDVRINNNYNSYLNSYAKADITNKKSIDENVDNYTDDNCEKCIDVDLSKEGKVYDKSKIDESINKLNKFLADEKTHAEYSKHKDLGTLMVKIVNDDDEVLLEVPPEKILDMVASMCKYVGILDEKA